ncbi:hypothetical protein [Streptomyces thermolineatus]|uniref:hypothetical protein n=1 Tax=Streptomyces thermolineatus TaxID=44033 RepID=UPI00384CC630
MRTTTTAALAALLLALPLTACGTPATPDSPADGTTTAAAEPSGPGDGGRGGENGGSRTPGSAQLPDLVGMGLQTAQDTAQKAGFLRLTSHDSLGRGRNQILDRDWKVCFQAPGPGRRSTDSEIDLGAVRLSEKCPDRDDTGPEAVGGKMPDFTGRSVKSARRALGTSTSIRVEDASGNGRAALMESNWKVCSQQPGVGAEFDGRQVTFTAVKFPENCP